MSDNGMGRATGGDILRVLNLLLFNIYMSLLSKLRHFECIVDTDQLLNYKYDKVHTRLQMFMTEYFASSNS